LEEGQGEGKGLTLNSIFKSAPKNYGNQLGKYGVKRVGGTLAAEGFIPGWGKASLCG